jgi:ATP-binding cassette subfamily B protein
MGAYANAEANYVSTLQGISTIQNYNRQLSFASLNKTIYNNYQEHVLSLGKIQIRLSLFANMYSVAFLTGIILYTSYSVLNGHLKTGELMAILSMCATLLPSTANLALLSIPFNEAKIAFDRMFEFALEKQTPLKEESEHSPIIIESVEFKNVCFRYPGRKLLFKDVSFTLRKGEILALAGKNGSGKSTLLQMLLGHYTPVSGQIIVNSKTDLQEIQLSQWLQHIAEVPQQVHLFNGTVLENIAFEDATNNPALVLQFLQAYGFAAFIETLPNSYMTLAGEEGVNLSGGQKQVIALARALYKKPQLLILDEATAAMDSDVEVFIKSTADDLLLLDKNWVLPTGNN